jgi:hypothetical protein
VVIQYKTEQQHNEEHSKQAGKNWCGDSMQKKKTSRKNQLLLLEGEHSYVVIA